jgi:hypothetical protein
LKRWLQLVGLGSNGGARARARLGSRFSWLDGATRIPSPLSLDSRTHGKPREQAQSNGP